MIKYHPDDNMLAEYSAGLLDWGLALIVKVHLSYSAESRKRVNELNALGSAFWELETDASNLPAPSFEKLMTRIRAIDTSTDEQKHQEDRLLSEQSDLPNVLQKIVNQQGQLKWKRVSPSLHEATLKTGQDKYEVCLHRINKGGKVAEHDHTGFEATVVLTGSFSDGDGTYTQGDFVVKEPGQVHRPTATQDQDCLCLSIISAPVKLTGPLGKLVNPFLSFQPG